MMSRRREKELKVSSYAWFEVTFTPQGPIIHPAQAEASRQALIVFLGEATTAFGADPRQVYLMGFSCSPPARNAMSFGRQRGHGTSVAGSLGGTARDRLGDSESGRALAGCTSSRGEAEV